MNQIARGNVIERNRHAKGVNASHLFDARLYQVEICGGKVSELTSNAIAETMYPQHDVEGSKYLPLVLPVDYQKDGNIIFLLEKEISIKGQTSFKS